ncbi:hypothetical protein [Microbacterium sp. TNHR37B]|uniref:hypothetical protein n=1 Tax=Microbacterium sp. TNHR37B TaxID=1775956 RepID=UPI0007B275E5|nr:hypothetical protein [Microbacterium sp. TNHR37B]KZE91940.1 hypothetical protein AVP41_01490 [Microbacterium sp. TNHR37B]
MQRSRAAVLALGAVFMFSLAGCAPTPPVGSTGVGEPTTAVSAPSAACGKAFDRAAAAIRMHYDTHPLYGPESDKLYENGLTDAEQKQLSKWIADDEAKYAKIIDPVYEKCDGWEDLYRAAYAQGPDSEWSLHGNVTVSDEQLREYFVVSYCLGKEDRRACADFVADDWR